MVSIQIVDADMHVRDEQDYYRQRLPEPYRRRGELFPADGFDRSIGGTLGKRKVDAPTQLADMDAEGIRLAILFPTNGLRIPEVVEPGYAAALSHAYNDWMAEYCQADPARLRGVALLQLADLDAAVTELERAATQLGLVAGMIPAYTRVGPRNPGDRLLDPLYATAERLGVPIAIHDGGGLSPLNENRFSTFAQVHLFSHVPAQMFAVTSTVIGGVFERFPRLKVGFMEAGCGWVPFWMEHMDEEIELRHSEVPYLSAKPSEYLTSGNAFFGVEPEEGQIAAAASVVGEEVLMYASDYPHWDSGWPTTARTLLDRTDLTDDLKRKLMSANALRFYGLESAVLATA